MRWETLVGDIEKAYDSIGMSHSFVHDREYLKSSFHSIENLWASRFDHVQEVNYVLLSEAPLWQDRGNYFYNEEAPLTQFLYKNDIAVPLGVQIRDKTELYKVLAEMGFVVLDASPLPLAEGFTSITYNSLSKKQYRTLMQAMIQSFLKEKMKIVLSRASDNVKFVFRYKRVESALKEQIELILLDLGVHSPMFNNIGQQGGGVDREIVKSLFSSNK